MRVSNRWNRVGMGRCVCMRRMKDEYKPPLLDEIGPFQQSVEIVLYLPMMSSSQGYFHGYFCCGR